jgi:hypothetical protein
MGAGAAAGAGAGSSLLHAAKAAAAAINAAKTSGLLFIFRNILARGYEAFYYMPALTMPRQA